ncbi:MAG: translation initiation factor IF-2 [Candidatus Omnitrophota bacterium]|nr:MAG: translation initiation factor IF-2 [Candidatus Omnitrophota bacterium]
MKKKKGPVKVSDLAKQLKLSSKELIGRISELGIGVNSDRSTLAEATVKKVKKAFSKKGPRAKVKPQKKVAKVKPKRKKPAKLIEPTVEENEIALTKAAPPKEEVIPKEKPPQKIVKVKFPITVKDLASRMSIGPSLLIKNLMDLRVFATINQLIDEGIAKQAGEKFGYRIESLPTIEQETMAVYEKQDLSKLKPRAPVITLMGHVDHGKTSLLDYIRKSKIIDFEKGGITQHIGAYRVCLDKGEITFLDTPGHEAFTAMRARGATATDIVILVVAADDGVKPQTIEAIDHARAAKVPIVVAVNKIDKPNIDIDKVKKQLSEIGLTAEDWGGKTITVNVSAKMGEGVEKLLEMILLEAEMLELKADPTKPAGGVVIEGKLSKGGGPVATVLVKNGSLHPGDVVICGKYYGKIRALIDDRIHKVKEAPPSMPVEILGLNGVPDAGDPFIVVDNERKAKEITELRLQKIKEEKLAPVARKISLEDFYAEVQKGKIKELKVILKTDVQGSLEALRDSLMKIDTKELKLNIIHTAVGDVNESDVLLAAASNAVIIGLHAGKTAEAEKAIKREGVDVKLYAIIYEAISDVKAALEGMLEPKLKDVFLGRAVVRQVFKISKAGTVAGCYVQKGTIRRTNDCRMIRNGKEVYKGKLSSLKRFKDDIKEAAEGYECGIGLDGFEDIQRGDIIEAFEVQKIARKL